MHSATAESFPFYEKCKKKIALTEKLGFRSIFFQNGRISAPPKISTDDYSTNTEAKEVVLGSLELFWVQNCDTILKK